VVVSELELRTLWFISVRWWVPPIVLAGTAAATLLGFDVEVVPLIVVAAFVAAYNTLFHFARGIVTNAAEHVRLQALHRFTLLQVGLDYAAMFVLIHFSGGLLSPLSFFAIFHIVFAAILLPRRHAYGVGVAVALGMAVVGTVEHLGLISAHQIRLLGEPRPPIDLHDALVAYGFFVAAITITAMTTTAIARMLRRRITDLAKLSERVVTLNERLRALYVLTQAIASRQRLDEVFGTVTRELAAVLEVEAVSIKMLSDDGAQLRYVAVEGLPEGWAGRVVDVARSPLHQRLLAGEPHVVCATSQTEMLQYSAELSAAGLRSVLAVPLGAVGGLIGVLAAYCGRPDRFDAADVEFLGFASKLVSVAIENARAYEAAERANEQRTRFMRQVAHNLRAPLGAMVSMTQIMLEGYLGELGPAQREQIVKVDRRARGLLSLIDELLNLAKGQQAVPTARAEPVDVAALVRKVGQDFQQTAAERGLTLAITAPDAMPTVIGDASLVEQVLENLVSNALKYTPSGGRVDVALTSAPDRCTRLEVRDTGIGIPEEDKAKLFTEFFRARNARTLDVIGTGLGLTLVKEVVERMGGRVAVMSELGVGSTFVVRFPPGPDAAACAEEPEPLRSTADQRAPHDVGLEAQESSKPR
jgi:signal transduction histidine kinase